MRLPSLAILLILVASTAAHANTIDDFVLAGNSHTISYSLPGTSSFPDFSLFNFFSESAPTTIDGVPGYNLSGAYYDTAFFPFVSLVLAVPSSIFGTPSLALSGSSFISFAFVPANNPYPYLPYDVVPTFIPGTYTLHPAVIQPNQPSGNYTLTITQETTSPTAVPEPATWALLSSGLLALLPGVRRRFLN